MICEPSVGCSLCRDLLFGDVGIRPPVVFVLVFVFGHVCKTSFITRSLSSRLWICQFSVFSLLSIINVQFTQNLLHSIAKSREETEEEKQELLLVAMLHFLACDESKVISMRFRVVHWVLPGCRAQLRPSGLRFGALGRQGIVFALSERGVGGWVGGVKNPILQSKLLSLSHFTPCIHNNTHPLQSHPLFYFQGFRVLAAIFSSFSSHSSSPSHIHPIKESFCAEHLVVCKLWSSFWAAATSATVSSWLTTRTGSPAAPQPLVSDAGSPPLAPSLDLSLLSCNGCYLSISSANFAQAIFHLVFAPKTTQALHQRVNKISACSSLVFHFMLFLHCSHKLHWGVRNLVALAGAWDVNANLRVDKYQRDGRYENCRCL